MSKIPASLTERNFRNLYLARASSVFGDGLVPVALAFGVLQVRNSPTALGIVLACRFISLVGLMPVSGVLADRVPRRLILMASDVLRLGVQGTTAGLLLTHSAQIWQLAVLSLLYGAGDAFFLPTSTGIIPQTVSAPRLQQANALIATTESACAVIGPVIAGAMVVTAGPGWTFVIDAVTFAVSAAFIARLPTIPAGDAEQESFLTELRAGWREFRSRTWMWMEVVYGAVAALAVLAPFETLGPVVAKHSLGGAAAWAAIMAAFGAGSIAGGLALMRLAPARPLAASVLALSLIALPAVFLAVPGPTAAIAAGAFAAGFGLTFYNTLIETTVQRSVPADVLSRLAAIDWMLSNSLFPLGAAIAGPIAALVGDRGVFLVSIAWMLASSAVMLLLRPVRGFQVNAAPPPGTG